MFVWQSDVQSCYLHIIYGDKSFGEVVFTKLKSTKHEQPGRAVVF